jgi:hypothetical protein
VIGESIDLGLASLVASPERSAVVQCILPVCRVGVAENSPMSKPHFPRLEELKTVIDAGKDQGTLRVSHLMDDDEGSQEL